MAYDPENSQKMKAKITRILSLLNTIASYSNAKNKKNLDTFTNWADLIFYRFYLASECGGDSDKDQDGWWSRNIVVGEGNLEAFCNAVTSIRFEFNKKGLPITFPKKIVLVGQINVGSMVNNSK